MVMVNGTVPISLLRASAAEFLVGNLSPAEASALFGVAAMRIADNGL